MWEKMNLVCSKCKASIFGDTDIPYGSFDKAEEAAMYASVVPHKCAPDAIKLAEAREIMKAYRAKYPRITLDEQMEVYKLLIQ